MNVGGATTARVVAMEDNTTVTLNGNQLTTLNGGQIFTFATDQYDIIDSNKPIFCAGRRGSGGDTNKGNIIFIPTSWAGNNFSFNAIRNNPQNLIFYAIENSTVNIYNGTTLLDSKTISAGSGTTLSWSQYGSYQVISTGAILAYHYSGSGNIYIDTKPLLTSHHEIIGFPSSSMRLTADFNGTNYQAWHSTYATSNGILDKVSFRSISPDSSGSLYRSSSLLIRADKKISGASFADGDGGSAAPFLPTHLMKKKHMINTKSVYVAFASKEAGSIKIYSPGKIIGVDEPDANLNLTRTGNDPNSPFKARLNVTNAGTRFASSVPVAVWYQPDNDTGGSKNDETILYGFD